MSCEMIGSELDRDFVITKPYASFILSTDELDIACR